MKGSIYLEHDLHDKVLSPMPGAKHPVWILHLTDSDKLGLAGFGLEIFSHQVLWVQKVIEYIVYKSLDYLGLEIFSHQLLWLQKVIEYIVYTNLDYLGLEIFSH